NGYQRNRKRGTATNGQRGRRLEKKTGGGQDRPRIGEPAGSGHRRLLRQPDAAESGRHDSRARAYDADRSTVRSVAAQQHRQVHPPIRAWAKPLKRRKDHKSPNPASHRRTTQTDGESGSRDRRRTSHRDTQRPTRRKRSDEEAAQGQVDL